MSSDDFIKGRSQAFDEVVAMLERGSEKFRECGDVVTADTFDLIRAKVQALREAPKLIDPTRE